ncbi:MAG: EAL domain-containing protein [Anaerolineaceae bacterium]|nr:EAL domain-containing protein [Anaerolineaceae bacterium]
MWFNFVTRMNSLKADIIAQQMIEMNSDLENFSRTLRQTALSQPPTAEQVEVRLEQSGPNAANSSYWVLREGILISTNNERLIPHLGKRYDQIFASQHSAGISHMEELARALDAGRGGTSWLYWQENEDRVHTSWTVLAEQNLIVGASRHELDMLEGTNFGDHYQRETVSTALATGILALLMYFLVRNRRKTRQLIETMEETVEQRTNEWMKAQRNYEYLFEYLPEALIIHDDEGILYVNQSAVQLFAAGDRENLLGKHVLEMVPNSKNHPLRGNLEMKESQNASTFEITMLRDNETFFEAEVRVTPIWFENRNVFLLMITDLSVYKNFERDIYFLSTHDPLTGLPNRDLLQDRLDHAIARSKRKSRRIGVLTIDMDEFKLINDAKGHEVGDEILKEIANRFKRCIRESDTLARLSGDEFVVLLENLHALSDVFPIVQKFYQAAMEPFWVGDEAVYISISMGISLYPDNSILPKKLLQYSEAAMYRAKKNGRNTYSIYADDLSYESMERLDLVNRLRYAVEHEEFTLMYQPQVDILSGKILGVEALLRWNNPELGFISPGRFIPIAEETGLILPIGRWVLHEACRQNRRWIDQGLPPMRMAVNISGIQLEREDMVKLVSKEIEETQMDPRLLELEICETSMLENINHSALIFHQLKSLGVRLAIDDFGTGYASLRYLADFPFDTVKVDVSFAQQITYSDSNAAIVRGMVTIAEELKMDTIAEGVETTEQLDCFRKLRCGQLQGWHFSPAVPPERITEMLQNHIQQN